MSSNLGLQIGEPIPLGARLYDRDENKFVQARLYDATDTELAASPVALSHLAGGLYTDLSVAMPNTSYVRANYDVYDDPGFVNLSPIHQPDTEQFFIDQVSQDVSNILSEVVMPDLIARIQDEEVLLAAVQEEDEILTASIVDAIEDVDIVNIVDGARQLFIDANNGSGAIQDAYKAWAWDTATATAVLADANEIDDLDDFLGVNAEAVAIDADFQAVAQGTVEGVLTGMGAEPGQYVYLGEVPGSFSLTPPAIGMGTNLIVGRAYPHQAGAVEARNLFIDPQIMG